MRKGDGQIWFGLAIIVVVVGIALSTLYFRVTGDIQVCQQYYPEMGLAQCYFSSKTVRVPGGK